MGVKKLQNIFIKILRSELSGEELDASVKEELTPDVVSALYSYSKHHDLAHIVSVALRKLGLPTDKETSSKFNQEEILSLYRYEQLKYSYSEICDTFEEKAIPYIPLKGSVIRSYYPVESMRTSCDIDILVKEEDLDAAADALVAKGFKRGEKYFHDLTMYSPSNVHLELHYNIRENIDELDAVLKDAWLYAVPVSGSRYEFSEDFFMFYLFAHMSYHFLAGGCGVRSLMDIWLIGQNRGITYVHAEELLKKAGIYVFAAEISKLTDICFAGKQGDSFSDALMAYIFDGGMYGSSQNKIAVEKENTKSTFRYLMQRLFLSYRDMSVAFPVLKKLPILLPFCWIIRIFKMVFGGELKASVAEIKMANQVSDSEIKKIKYLKEKLEL